MTNTASRAYLAVPFDVFALLCDTFGELGQEERIGLWVGPATMSESIDMDGVEITPDRDQNLYLVTSGDLSDHDVALGEEAFMAGYHAAKRGQDPHDAWNSFVPSLDYADMSRYNRNA